MFFPSSRHGLLAMAAVPALALGILFAMVVLDSRHDVTEHVLQTHSNLANTVEENIQRTLDFYDRSLRGVADEVVNPEVMGLPANIRQRVVFDKAVTVPGVATLSVIGADGTPTMSTDPELIARSISVADRPYFVRHRDRQEDGLGISEPVISRFTGRAVVVLSRRVELPGGGFGGVVVVSLDVRYFNSLFNAVNLGQGGRITLMLSDGVILSRYPADDTFIRRSFVDSPVFQRYLRGDKHFRAVSQVDGVERFYVFKPFDDYPLLIVVAQPTELVYGDWRKRTFSLGLITLGLIATCLGLVALFVRELNARQRAAQQLRTAEHDLRTILDGLPSMVAYWDRQLRIRFANSRYLATFAAGHDETLQAHPGLQAGQRLYGPNAAYFERALHGERQEFETPVTDSAGARRYMLVSFVPDLDDGGEVDGVFVQATDITERKAAEDRLFEEKERFRVTLASIGDAVISTDAAGRVTYLNPVAEAMTGWSPGEAAGTDVGRVVPLQGGEDTGVARNPVVQALREQRIVPPSPAGTTLTNRQRQRFDIEDTAAPILDRDGETVGAVMVLRDVTQARAMALRMVHLAHYDALTGLPNRLLLQDRATQAIARGSREGTGFALMYLDLDGFKDINDSLGHDAGDAVLVQFARRLSAALRQSDTLSRQGGDEFVVLAPMVPDAEAAHALAAKLVRLAALPFEVDGRELRVTTSLGIALFPEDGSRFDLLSRHADAAMYTAKRAGKNQLRFYTGEIGREADDQLEREHLPPAV